MKKFLKRHLGLLLSALMIISLIPVGAVTIFADDIIVGGSVTVDFNSNGGTPVESQTVYIGTLNQRATQPENPEKVGCKFVGWYDETLTEEYDFSSLVSESMTLYAKWECSFETLKEALKNPPKNLPETYADFEAMLNDESLFEDGYGKKANDAFSAALFVYYHMIKDTMLVDFTGAEDGKSPYEISKCLLRSQILFEDAAKLIEASTSGDTDRLVMTILEIYPDFVAGWKKAVNEDPEESSELSYEEIIYRRIRLAAKVGNAELAYPRTVQEALTQLMGGKEAYADMYKFLLDRKYSMFNDFMDDAENLKRVAPLIFMEIFESDDPEAICYFLRKQVIFNDIANMMEAYQNKENDPEQYKDTMLEIYPDFIEAFNSYNVEDNENKFASMYPMLRSMLAQKYCFGMIYNVIYRLIRLVFNFVANMLIA